MIVRRTAIASILAASALVIAGCGMMNKGPGGVMTVPLSGQSEVPPNASGGSGSGKVELDGNVIKWNITYSGMTGPVTAGHFHGPAQPGANAGVVVPFAGPLASPILGHADAGAGRPGQARPLVHQPAHRRQSGRGAARPGQVTSAGSARPRHPEGSAGSLFRRRGAAGQADRGAFAFSSSRRRRTLRCTLPVVVIGRASMNSISFGYS